MKVKDILKYLANENLILITSFTDSDHPFEGLATELPEEYKDLEVHSFRTNVNRYEWSNKEHRYKRLSVDNVTSELEIFVYT